MKVTGGILVLIVGIVALFVWLTYSYVNKETIHKPGTDSQNSKLERNQDTIFVVEANQENNSDIKTDGVIRIKDSARQVGSIEIGKGDLIVGGNVVIKGDILVKEGSITIGNSTQIEGDIIILNGDITVGGNGIFRDITIDNGNIEIGNSNHIGNIYVESGNIHVGGNNTIDGSINAKNGRVILGNSNNISGSVSGIEVSKGGNNTIQVEL